MSIKSLCLVLVWMFFHAAFDLPAQDYSAFNQFFVNPAFINPSLTGMEGRPALFVSYRKQWAGVSGSPSLAGVSFQTPLENNLSFGVTAMDDSKGLVSTSTASFTGAYSLTVAENMAVRFGLSLGGGWNRVDVDQLRFVTAGDPVMTTLLDNNFQLMGNAGISFHTPGFHVGFSMPNIFQPVYVSPDPFTVSQIKPFNNIILSASNRFYFSKDKYVFEPYAIYHIRGTLPAQFEIAGILHMQNLVWVGASLRQNFGVSALAGLKLNKVAAVGYSYSIKTTGDNAIGRPSHEVQLALLFGQRKKKVHVYSFVDVEKEKHKKTPAELAAEKKKQNEAIAAEKKKKEEAAALAAAEKKRQEDAAAAEKKKQEEAVAQQQAPVQQPPVQQPPAGGKPRFSTAVVPAVVIEHDPAEEEEKLKRLEEHKDDPDAHHGLADTVHAHAERHEFVKRGTHVDEMDLNDYVIVGAFRGKDNAQKFSTGLKAMNFTDTDYGFISSRNVWYVYVYSGNDLAVVRAERDKYRKMKMFKDAWLLTVHE